MRIKGGEWNSKVYFDPEADNRDKIIQEITDQELMDRLKDLVGVNEPIEYVGKHKCPLSEKQWTAFIFFHMFILFQTGSWWWTIEKNTEGLTIQRSKYIEAVRDHYRCDKRLPITVLEADTGRCTVYDLVGWLYRSNELNKPYDLVNSNCQHFGKRVFDYVKATRFKNIYFDPEVDKGKGEQIIREITDDQFMSKLHHLEGVNEDIVTLWGYDGRCRSPWKEDFQFILFETSSWWWTVEKNNDGITIQRSKHGEAVKYHYRCDGRCFQTGARIMEESSDDTVFNVMYRRLTSYFSHMLDLFQKPSKDHNRCEKREVVTLDGSIIRMGQSGNPTVYDVMDWLYKSNHLNEGAYTFRYKTSDAFRRQVLNCVCRYTHGSPFC